MSCKNITEKLYRVASFLERWQQGDTIPQIERDIALGALREVYNELLVLECGNSVHQVAQEPKSVELEQSDESDFVNDATEEAEPESESEERDPFYDALDIDALLGLSDEPATEQSESVAEESVEEAEELFDEPTDAVEESVEDVVEDRAEDAIEEEAEMSVELEPTSEPTSEPVKEPSVDVAKSLSGGLFDLNDIPVRSKSKRKMISLYSDAPVPTVAEPETKVEAPNMEMPKVEVEISEPVQPVQRLGDSFAGVTTLADKMAQDDAPTTPFNRIKDLRQAIGLNDKFLMIRDLFGGDAERYEATIDTLDEFDDLDECIIYIVENFRWNPDLEASKLLISIIERKLA